MAYIHGNFGKEKLGDRWAHPNSSTVVSLSCSFQVRLGLGLEITNIERLSFEMNFESIRFSLR